MSIYGIAAAIVGDADKPIFHCNVISTNPQKANAVIKNEDDSIQKRLASDLEFNTKYDQFKIEEVLDSPEKIRETSKRFLDVVDQVVQLQEQDKRLGLDNYPVQVILGQDASTGTSKYNRAELRKQFVQADPNRVSRLLPHCQITYGDYNSSGHTAKGFETEVIDTAGFKLLLKSPMQSVRDAALDELKEQAQRDGIRLFRNNGLEPLSRFMGFEATLLEDGGRFAYLKLHPDIERELVNSIRQAYYATVNAAEANMGDLTTDDLKQAGFFKEKTEHLHHLFVQTENKPNPFFTDVLKTLLLDQISKSEDGKERISDTSNILAKRRITRDLGA